MKRRTNRYCVMSMNKGIEQYVDSFDLLDQANLCVLRMQTDYSFFLRDKQISFPDLAIRDTRECPIDQPVIRKNDRQAALVEADRRGER